MFWEELKKAAEDPANTDELKALGGLDQIALSIKESQDVEATQLTQTLAIFLGLANAKPTICDVEDLSAQKIAEFQNADILFSKETEIWYARRNDLVVMIAEDKIYLDEGYEQTKQRTIAHKMKILRIAVEVDQDHECFFIQKSIDELDAENVAAGNARLFSFGATGWEVNETTDLYCFQHLNGAVCLQKKADEEDRKLSRM